MTLAPEGHDDDGDAIVGVWDRDGTRCAGHLRLTSAARVAGLIELGLAVRSLVLSEERTLGDGRRTVLHVLVYLPATVEVEIDAREPFPPGDRSAFADRAVRRRVRPHPGLGSGAGTGPASIEDLPVSSELKADLAKLRAQARDPRERELFGPGFVRRLVEQRSVELWQRTRRELGRSHAVGYLGPTMDHPVWSPDELDATPDAEIELEDF